MIRYCIISLALMTAGLAPTVPAVSAVPPAAAPKPEAASVKASMTKEISPAFTDVSFQLFHAEPSQERMVAVTGKLDEVISKFSKTTARAHDQEAFRVSAVLLKSSVEGLKLAVLNGAPRAELEHWFGHVGAACNTCHSEMRDGQ